MPQTSLNNYAVYNPLFNSNTEHKYTIMIKTPDGCISVDTLLVRMFKQVEIYVPSGFSPNGDHHNDVLLPQLVGVKELKYFKVFDRWGQLVYQTNEFGKGWDGVYKGTRQPMESYLWIAEGIDVYGKAIKRTGSSILVR
jgi:gliding motility-associated-like protein